MSSVSATSSYSSPNDVDEDDDSESEWDEEEMDEEIMEIREVLERSRVTVSHLEESSDSLDNEDNELIKAKLRALRDYVSDLQASYNELLLTFKQLEDAAKQKVTAMEGKLSAALRCAKDFQNRCNTLESQLKQLHYNRHDNSCNDSLPLYTSGAQSQISALEEDLSAILKAITQGVESGVIKLSGLQLLTQETPIPLQDVIISSNNRPHPHNESKYNHVNGASEIKTISNGVYQTNTHSTGTDIYSTRPDTHIGTDINSTRPDSHSTGDVTHSTGTGTTGACPSPDSHSTLLDSHSTGVDTHSISPDTHSTSPDTHSTRLDSHSTGIDTHSTSPDSHSIGTGTAGADSNSNRTDVKSESHSTDGHVTVSVNHVTITPPSTAISLNDRKITPINAPLIPGAGNDYSNTLQDTPIITPGTHPQNDHARRELLFQQIEQFSKETQTCSLPETNAVLVTANQYDLVTPPNQYDLATPPNQYDLDTPHNQYNNGSVSNIDYYNEVGTGMSLSDNENGALSNHEPLTDDDILAQILEKDCRIAELETCIQNLNHQLQESQHLNESIQVTLQDNGEIIHKEKINEVIKAEGELSDIHVIGKSSHYESEREQLQLLVVSQRNKVLELEQKREEAIIEMKLMKQTINTLSHTDESCDHEQIKLSSTETNLQAETDELQSQRKVLNRQCNDAEEKVMLLQTSLRAAKQEANKLQAITARKESELTRVISVIHTTRAKLASIHQTDRTQLLPANECVDDDINGIDWDITIIKQKWEELCLDLSNHEAAIASLTGRELTLQSELDHRAARVIELESFLQARELGMGFNKKSVSEVQTTVELLKNELSSTKRNYTIANQQMIEMCHILQSNVHVLVDQLQLLQNQVSSKDKQINNLETEQKQLLEIYQLNNNKITEDGIEWVKKEESLRQLSNELLSAQQRIEELEETMDDDHELRIKDIDYQKAVIMDMINGLDNEGGVVIDEMMEPDSLQSKIAQRDRLLQTLQEQTTILMEQHSSLIQQTDHTQDIVSNLETRLLTTQTLCDALEQEVADGHKKLAQIQQQLIESEKDRIQLREQLQTLRHEAEDTCNSLENALIRNATDKQQNTEQFDTIRRQYCTQQIQQQNKVIELNGIIDNKIDQLSTLHDSIQGLQSENIQLHNENKQHQTLVAKLKEELEMNNSQNELLATMGALQIQLDNAESVKIISDTIATERLNDVMILQERNEELLSVNKQLKQKLSDDTVTNERIVMLSEEIKTVKSLYDAKSIELDKMKYSYQLAMEKETTIIEQLEECRHELAICKKRADELDIRYQSTLSDLSVSQTELDSLRTLHSSEQLVDGARSGQVFELKTKIRKLTGQLKEGRNEFEQLQSLLKTANEEKRRLLHKLGTLEEHYHSLIRNNSQQKLDLSRGKIQNDKQRKLCLSLQSEYDSLTDQVSEWAIDHKTTTEALVQKIRDQDNEITTLKQRYHELMTDNEQLRNRMITDQQPLIELPQLHNQYQEVLEKGLSSTSALDTSGYSSPSESTDELDKSYWIKRAGELSMQLQQSSQYWSAKVREQSLKIQRFETTQ